MPWFARVIGVQFDPLSALNSAEMSFANTAVPTPSDQVSTMSPLVGATNAVVALDTRTMLLVEAVSYTHLTLPTNREV